MRENPVYLRNLQAIKAQAEAGGKQPNFTRRDWAALDRERERRLDEDLNRKKLEDHNATR